MTPTDLDVVANFLAARLRAPLPGAEAQWRFAPRPVPRGWSPDLRPTDARVAAALVLVHPGASGPAVALTRRRTDLPHHPGQISLPGGAVDAGEAIVDAALRETWEEIGVDPAEVRVLGPLSTLWVHPSNFVLHPFVATMGSTPLFRPHAAEVDAMVEAPLEILLNRARTGWSKRERRGVTIDYPYFDVGGAEVWGATAMVLCEFVSLWQPAHGPDEPE